MQKYYKHVTSCNPGPLKSSVVNDLVRKRSRQKVTDEVTDISGLSFIRELESTAKSR